MGPGLRHAVIDSRPVGLFLNALERWIGQQTIVFPGARRLRFGSERRGVYRPVRRDAGFFSQCTTTLVDLVSLSTPARKVIARGAFEAYRSVPATNSWNKFFSKPSSSDPVTKRSGDLADLAVPAIARSQYSALDFALFGPSVERFFQPSEKVAMRINELVARYRIQPTQLIVVNIRGTDKWKEISSPPVQNFVKWAEKASRREPSAEVLLVTDDSGVAEKFETAFSGKVIRFSELPMSSRTNSPIHRGLPRSQREKFAVDFLATAYIMSAAKILITHTGNVALWTVLFRGHSRGLVQLYGDTAFGSLSSAETDGESQDCPTGLASEDEFAGEGDSIDRH